MRSWGGGTEQSDGGGRGAGGIDGLCGDMIKQVCGGAESFNPVLEQKLGKAEHERHH